MPNANDADVRVLRRFRPRTQYAPPSTGVPYRTGLYLDVETTSLDRETAKIVELGMIRFEYDETGRVLGVIGEYEKFEDPGEEISEEATATHGLTRNDVRGFHIDNAEVQSYLGGVSLVIAHNAGYDRPVVERRFPFFTKQRWACSYREVPWKEKFGAPCGQLGHLLMETCGEFCPSTHRALDDCRVGVHLLTAVDGNGDSALSHLLASAASDLVQIVVQSPFRFKDALKARRVKGQRYHWNEDPKGWAIELSEADAAVELELLHRVIALRPGEKRQFIPRLIGAVDRYAVRG